MADSFSFTGSFRAVEDRMRQFDLTRRMVAFADMFGPVMQRRIRDRAPRSRGPNSGRLADSTRYRRRTMIGAVRMEWTSNVPYAPYVIKGTRPHVIRPRTALALHWTGPSGGDVFARRVNHPGTKANNYPVEALRDVRPMVAAMFYRAFAEK